MTSAPPMVFSATGPLSRQWLPVASSADVQDAPAGVRLLGRDLVLWRGPSGAIVAAPDRCTHSKGDLARGEVSDGRLACPKHGWTFGDEGRCVFKPSGLPITEKAHLKTYRSAERYGVIWLSLGEPAAPLVEIAADGDPAYRRVRSEVSMWRCHAMTIAERLLSLSNSPYAQVTAGLPFVVHGTCRPAGVEYRRTVAIAPVDGRGSLVTTMLWAGREGDDADAEVPAEALADLDVVRSSVESGQEPSGTDGMDGMDSTDEDSGAAAEWRSRFLELMREGST